MLLRFLLAGRMLPALVAACVAAGAASADDVSDFYRGRTLTLLVGGLREARAHRMLVVHTVTRNGTAADLADAVKPIEGERVYSAKFDKFHGNDLEEFLRRHGVGTVIATGTSANGCLLFTVAGAVLRDLRVIVPIDGLPAATAYQEQFVAWEIANAPVIHERATLTRFDAISFLK